MAWSFTKDGEFVAGSTRFTYGTFATSSTEEGGDIYTGLQKVYGMMLQHKASAVVAGIPVLNETFPKADPITVVQTASADGYWLAFGV